MAAFQKFNCFVEDVSEKKHNLASDSLKLMLTNSAPVATNTVKANITEITAANGYSAGGIAVGQTSSAQSSGVYKLVVADALLTASGGSIGPFQYAVLYNATNSADGYPLIGFWNYGSAVTLLTTESMSFDFDQTNGVLQLT